MCNFAVVLIEFGEIIHVFNGAKPYNTCFVSHLTICKLGPNKKRLVLIEFGETMCHAFIAIDDL
jgi:hypothetical protein